MQLFEGAKISQQILRQAIGDPNFTFGIEAEFYLEGAAAYLQQHMTQGLETRSLKGVGPYSKDGEYFVKKLSDIDWQDVVHFFSPLGVQQGDNRPPSDVIRDRLAKLYEQQMELNARLSRPDAMWDELKEHLDVHVLITALRIYPERRLIGLPESQEKALRDIVYDGNTDEIKPFGKLRDIPVATTPTDVDNYYNPSSNEDTMEVFYSLVAKDLSAKLGTEVGYVWNDERVFHVGDYKIWIVTSDSSLNEHTEEEWSGGRDILGVEVVSPIMGAEEGLTMLNKMLEIMNGEILGLNVFTTEETGLHINLGVKNKEIDPIKILVLSGDEHIVNKFDRANSEHASSVQGSMRDRMADVASGEVPHGMDASMIGTRKDVNTLISRAQEVLRGLETDERDIDRVIAVLNDIKPEGKSHSIDFSKLPSGYVEYRAIGNKDYEKRKSEIISAVLHMIGITHIATEPSVYRKEFLKKLYLMVQRTVANTDVSQDITLARKFGGAGDGEPLTASVGMVGRGPRGGYGAPIEDSEPTQYDGEAFLTRYGFDPGSETQ